jgi:acetolactate synthase-1/2/3 large subunit
MIDLKHPGQSYLRCAGSLGWAFPAAMGAKCAYPDRPVVCFAGDGGVWYHLQELDTARKYGINTITVLNNNHSFNQEKRNVELTFGGQSKKSDELWLFEDLDFAAVARSMGCVGLTVNTPDEFAPAFHQALNANKPVLIDVKSHIEGVAPRAWMPK